MDWIDLAKYRDKWPALVKEKVDLVFEETSPSEGLPAWSQIILLINERNLLITVKYMRFQVCVVNIVFVSFVMLFNTSVEYLHVCTVL